MAQLNEKKVALVATHGFEQQELQAPKEALERAGAKVFVLSPEEGSIRGWKDKKWGDSVGVDRDLSQATADEYDALMLPGGVMNADKLRANEDVVRFVGEFFSARKPIAAICHAPWLLIEAGRLEGRRVTSYYTLKTDLVNAGADWVDEPAVEDGNLLTSRAPPDLPQFNQRMIDMIANWTPTAKPEEKEEESKLDRDAKMREDGEGPSAKSAQSAQRISEPIGFDASEDANISTDSAREMAAANDVEPTDVEIEGSAETEGMGSRRRKFVGSRRNTAQDASATAAAPEPKEPELRADGSKETAGEERAARRGKKKTQRQEPPQAGRGMSSKFAARREPPGVRGPRGK